MAAADDDVTQIEEALASGDETIAKAAPTAEVGVTGLKVWGGVVQHEEFLRQLQGIRGVKVYREMSDNDSTVGALLSAVELMIRPVEWNVEAVDESAEAQEAAEFVKSCLNDMSHTFEDFMSECLTMLSYGWSYFEIVYKRRVGPDEKDPKRRSQHDDGRIGWRKLAPRAQDTLDHWMMQDDGGIEGMVQVPPDRMGIKIELPIEKCLLFRTTSRKNNPEGRSILRTAYRAWYLLKTAQDYESIGIERELCGLPVMYVPDAVIRENSSALMTYLTAVRDLKLNEQAGLVLPSDVWTTNDGQPTAVRKVEFKLVTSGGQRSINTSEVITRYQRDMARSVLADFLMLGTDGRGSYALSTDKTELFLRAVETPLWQIASVLNRHALPRLWELNGFKRELMPRLAPGKVAPTDLSKLAAFLESCARMGMPLFPDPDLETYVRSEANLPEAGSLMIEDARDDDSDEPEEDEDNPPPDPDDEPTE